MKKTIFDLINKRESKLLVNGCFIGHIARICFSKKPEQNFGKTTVKITETPETQQSYLSYSKWRKGIIHIIHPEATYSQSGKAKYIEDKTVLIKWMRASSARFIETP